MKKFFLILYILLLITTCGSKETLKSDNKVLKEQETIKTTEENPGNQITSVNVTSTAQNTSVEKQKEQQQNPEKQKEQESITATAKVITGKKQKEIIEKESERFFPAAVGNKWFYQGYWKNDKDKKIVKVKAEILNTEKRDGKEYFYYYAPKVGIRYLNRKDETGVYMRVIKFPFPIFSFALIEVDIEPEMLVIKFPFKVGEKWTQKAKASTTLFGVWKISRDIQSDFEVVEKVKIKTGAGEIEAYHIRANVDNSYEKTVENYWYGKDIGYSVSDTTSYFVQVDGYIIKDEKTGEIKQIIPEEGIKEYE